MVVPVVIVAVGVYFVYAPLGLAGSLLGLVLAHTALAAPFVVITVQRHAAGLRSRPGARRREPRRAAARSCSCRIILPLIVPGVISGALFAFITSFDEVVVALFLTGPAERTLPRQMFNGIRENISPVITAAARLLILLSVAAADRARAAAPAQRAPARHQADVGPPIAEGFAIPPAPAGLVLLCRRFSEWDRVMATKVEAARERLYEDDFYAWTRQQAALCAPAASRRSTWTT